MRAGLLVVSLGVGVALVLLFAPILLREHHTPVAPNRASLRALMDNDPRNIFMYDEASAFRLKPSFRGPRDRAPQAIHQTDALGLLVEDLSAPASNGTPVLLLGDSVLYGSHVPFESTFGARLQQALAPIINLRIAACPGWSGHQAFSFFDNYLTSTPWSNVVYCLCLNDLLRYDWIGGGSDGQVAFSSEWHALQKDEALWTACRLGWMKLRWEASTSCRPLARHAATTRVAWLADYRNRFLQEELLPFARRVGKERLDVVLLPTLFQLQAVAIGCSPSIAFVPQKVMGSALRNEGIRVWDAAEVFHDAVPEYCFYDDVHLSAEGHRRIAEATANLLRTGQSQ